MEYNLNGKISLDDYIQFNKTHKRQGFFNKIIKPIFYLILIILIALVLILVIKFPLDVIKKNPAAIVLIALGCGLILYSPIGMRLKYKKHYNTNKLLQQTASIKINEQSISIITESGTEKLTKNDIYKIIYDKDSIYIYIGISMAHALKKRFLENENDFEELVKFVKSNYEKNNVIVSLNSN